MIIEPLCVPHIHRRPFMINALMDAIGMKINMLIREHCKTKSQNTKSHGWKTRGTRRMTPMRTPCHGMAAILDIFD